MKTITITRGMRAVLLGATLCAAAPLHAQLPDARALIAKYNTAVGGAALLKYKSSHAIGTFEMPTAGLSGSLDVFRRQPNHSFMRVTLPGLGEITKGFDGTTAWAMDPIQGARVMVGPEAVQLAEDADVATSLRDPKFFTSMETVEKTSMGGKECYKVKLEWKSGHTSYDCYDVDTGLMAGNIMTQESPQGALEVTTIISEYKTFGDIKFPARMTQQVMGQEQIITITSFEFDKVDDALFALPPAIQALVKK